MGDKNISQYGRLEELGDSNYEIADGEPNIKGWDVQNAEGQKIGEVDELLFDPYSRKVRYLIVDLDNNKLDIGEHKKVLIPIGVAEIGGKGDNDINRRNRTATGTTDNDDEGRNYVRLGPVDDKE